MTQKKDNQYFPLSSDTDELHMLIPENICNDDKIVVENRIVEYAGFSVLDLSQDSPKCLLEVDGYEGQTSKDWR